MTNQIYSKIKGTGSYLPKKILTNEDLTKMVDTTDEWIKERTGVEERRIASIDGGEFCSDMAAEASKKAIESAGLSPNDVDFILLGTVSGDYILPSTSAVMQQKIGITNECPCLDIVAACSGFVYGLVLADSLIKAGLYKNILVIGAEMLSPIINWKDRTTCILFSDGAGAAIIGRSDDQSKIVSSTLSCDGTGDKLLFIPGGGTTEPLTGESIKQNRNRMLMEGKPIFKYATRTMMKNFRDVLKKSKTSINDIDWFIPHQANLRIIEYIAKKLEFNMEKVIITVDKLGNNSAATIPIALDIAIRDGRIKKGDKIAMATFGAGVTSGAIIIDY